MLVLCRVLDAVADRVHVAGFQIGEFVVEDRQAGGTAAAPAFPPRWSVTDPPCSSKYPPARCIHSCDGGFPPGAGPFSQSRYYPAPVRACPIRDCFSSSFIFIVPPVREIFFCPQRRGRWAPSACRGRRGRFATILRRLFHGRPVVDVQFCVQLRQPRGFFFQLRFLRERACQLLPLPLQAAPARFKPALHRFVPLRHLGEGVVDADKVAPASLAQLCRGSLPLRG